MGKTKNTTVKCKECNKKFRKHSWTNQRFCSQRCYFKYIKKKKRVVTNCEVCNKELSLHRSLFK
jgi:ssDNA-binding Zn-finger/Zn-ribbon topoisomerase 1